MSDYKIKLEDKAAFLNRLEKQGIAVDSFDIKDNKLGGYFEFNVDDPQVNEIIKTILKQSPKINKLKEMKSTLTKGQLRQIIREELDAFQNEGNLEEASVLTDPNFIAGIAALLGVTGTYATSVIKAMKNKSAEEKKKIAADMAAGMSKATGA
jgi:predicted house-cleaning noncanonical NTP pyrophosphatase (MazG superfamily)